MKQHLQMDWIDAIFIVSGFSLGLVFVTFFPNSPEISSQISIAGVFLGPPLRRAIFGPPKNCAAEKRYTLEYMLGFRFVGDFFFDSNFLDGNLCSTAVYRTNA